MLNLKNPIVFFDLESTGIDPYNDRIIQIAAIKYMPDGTKTEYDWKFNPGIPIPPGSTEIHGITDEMVRYMPRLGDKAEELSKVFMDVDLGGFNIKYFDIPLLKNEFERIGLTLDTEDIKLVDAMLIYKLKEPRTLTAAYAKYVGGTFENAHDAMADIRASVEVLEGQMKEYDDISPTVDAIHEFCFPADPSHFDNEGKLRYIDKELCINFGKNKGKTLTKLAMSDPGYLRWILDGSFSEKVKEAIRSAMR